MCPEKVALVYDPTSLGRKSVPFILIPLTSHFFSAVLICPPVDASEFTDFTGRKLF